MTLQVFSRPEEFVQALRVVKARYLLRSHSALDWNLQTRTFGTITCMMVRNGGASIYQGAMLDAHALLIGLSRADGCLVNGNPMCDEHVIWMPPGHEFHAPTQAGMLWASIIVPRGEVQQWTGDMPELERQFLGFRAGRADAIAVKQLTGLLARIMGMSVEKYRTAPQLLSALHDQLGQAVRDLLSSLPPPARGRRGRPPVDGPTILQDVMHLMEQNLDHLPHMDDFCSAVGVSPSTLRKLFHEQLGMSPHRYLALRRLHAIHGALQAAGPGETISSICSRFGVWDFGRFAAHYRQLFGASPSRALRRGA